MANSSEQIDHLNYVFKRSRIAIALHMMLLLVMLYCLFQTMYPMIWLGCLLTSIVAYLIYLKRPFVEQLQHLDQDDWSLKYSQNTQPQSVKIDKIIDHQVYILISFNEKRQLSLLIWQDQVSKLQWKSLKTRAKLV